MKLIEKFKKKYKERLWFRLFIWGIIVSLIFFILEDLSCQQQTEKIVNLTTKQYNEMMNKCFDTIQNLTILKNFTCTEPKIATITCMNNPKIVNNSLLIDGCDSIYKMMNLSDEGYSAVIIFKSIWYPDNDIHYLLDISKDLESNRISLFTENNFLKLRIYQENGTETTLKIRIDNLGFNWNNNEWYRIEIKWFKPSGQVFLNINYNDVAEDVLGKIELDLQQTKLFLGSDAKGKNQADGFFNYIFVTQYIYPEPTYTIEHEQHVG